MFFSIFLRYDRNKETKNENQERPSDDSVSYVVVGGAVDYSQTYSKVVAD